MHEEIETREEVTATEVEAVRDEIAGPAGDGGAPDKDAVIEALKNVYDPELGINIVDLGLVYDVQTDGQGGVDIQYSLTTMGCPIGPMIEDQMRGFLKGVPNVGEVRPDFVLRPPWSPEMMSDEAKAALGIF
ncbi:MAG: metal-sulfur cluster assembly factor [Actinomycetota bacterium]